MTLNQIVLLALIGTVAGIMGGLLGLGGALIIIPALVMLMGYSQQMAQGTTLLMMVLPVGLLAAIQYYQKGYVDLKAALIMAVFFMISGYFGAKLSTRLPQELLRKGFAVLLVLIALKMWFSPVKV